MTKLQTIAKLFGGTLMVAGTAIGAGMLALPVATAAAGFKLSALLLIVCWTAMTASALLLLEVTLWMPRNAHLVSMAGKTLGPIGQIFAWFCYLMLLYSLLSAYIAGGSDLLASLLKAVHLDISLKISAVIFTVLLGAIVFRGIFAVDIVNRVLMSVKFIAFIILVCLIAPFVNFFHQAATDTQKIWMTGGTTVAITSFGFSVIIPSLRNYFHDNVKHLRIIIMLGSLLPLVCYLIWNAIVMGVIPQQQLLDMLHSGQPASGLIHGLRDLLQNTAVTGFARLFTSVCMLTSFLGVGLSLADFLADGFGVVRKGRKNLYLCLLAMLPPLFLVMFRPGIFVTALSYAGMVVILLMVILPVLMIWRGRYQLSMATGYRVKGGKLLLILLMVFSAVVLTEGILTL